MTPKLHGAVVALLLCGTPTMATPMKIAAATSAEQCLKQSFELADLIQARDLSETDLDRLDDMLAEMETHCESNRFADAATVANTIVSELEQTEQ